MTSASCLTAKKLVLLLKKRVIKLNVCPKPVERLDLPSSIDVVTVSIDRASRNPFTELCSFFNLCLIFRRHKPDIVHLVTIKPYLYGGLAARLTGVPAVVSAVAGLGSLFSMHNFRARLKQSLLLPLFKLAFGHKNQLLLFQNESDPQVLRQIGAFTGEKRLAVIKGAGVDLQEWIFHPAEGLPIVLMASRLLIQKGVLNMWKRPG